MSGKDDRESWSQVPGTPELWASDTGQIATLRPGGGFDILPQRTNQFGEQLVKFRAEGKKTKVNRFVAAMVLVAFAQKRPGSRRVGDRDDNPGNCHLSNLAWVRRGESRVVDLVKRKCLGRGCGAMFMSEGPGNRLCPACSKRANESTSNIFEETESGELPDDPLCGVAGNPHK